MYIKEGIKSEIKWYYNIYYCLKAISILNNVQFKIPDGKKYSINDLQKIQMWTVEKAKDLEFSINQMLTDNTNTLINIKIYLKVENIINNTKIIFENGESHLPFEDEEDCSDSLEDIRGDLLNEMIEKIDDSFLDKWEKDQVKQHLYLLTLADRIISKNEWKKLTKNHIFICKKWFKPIWEHNIRCILHFTKLNRQIIEHINIFKSISEKPLEILKIIKELKKLVGILEETRHNFSFCLNCKYNGKKCCLFWHSILTTLKKFIKNNKDDTNFSKITKYILNIKNICKCPQSIEDLKNINGGI